MKEQNENLFKAILILGVFSAMSIFLLGYRVYKTESITYLFFVWNLFLAWVPLLPAILLNRIGTKTMIGKSLALGLLGFWLLFFPNAPYIITDLFHFKSRNGIDLWYDLVLIVSFAWSGLLVGFLSANEVQQFLKKRLGGFLSWVGILGFMFASGYGIYIGRYIRLNSWDLIRHPLEVTKIVLQPVLDPLSNMDAISFTLVFSSFLIVSYITVIALANHKNSNVQA